MINFYAALMLILKLFLFVYEFFKLFFFTKILKNLSKNQNACIYLVECNYVVL